MLNCDNMDRELIKEEVILFNKVIIPLLEKFTITGLLGEDDIKFMKKKVKASVFPTFEMGPFIFSHQGLIHPGNGRIRFEDYLDDKNSLKDDLPDFILENLATDCYVIFRDLFVSYITYLADKSNMDLGFSCGTMILDESIYVILMKDYNIERRLTPMTQHVAFLALGENKFDMKILRIGKFKNHSEMKDIISEITGAM